MMKFVAEITARWEEGVLERILRICRHRGFAWESLQAKLEVDMVRVELTGRSERVLSLLLRQLEKLDEVLSVRLHAPIPQGLPSVPVGRDPSYAQHALR